MISIPENFEPVPYLRAPMVQTTIASLKPLTWGKNAMKAAAREIIFSTPEGIRLQAYHSPHPFGHEKGLVILIHGWEGSAESAYILHTGRWLYDRGYSVVRLNLRDHGESHGLNSGLFYATLLDEVKDAVSQAVRLAGHRPAFLVGFSLGGNFVLRIATSGLPQTAINLRHITAISPVLDPRKATAAIDAEPLIRGYFLKKWRKSLRKKQRAFPNLYDFTDVLSLNSCRKITDALITTYSDYQNAADYFSRYTLTGIHPFRFRIPAVLIAAADDPIIPVEDYQKLHIDDSGRLIIHPHGGHNGFVQDLCKPRWYERFLIGTFDSISSQT